MFRRMLRTLIAARQSTTSLGGNAEEGHREAGLPLFLQASLGTPISKSGLSKLLFRRRPRESRQPELPTFTTLVSAVLVDAAGFQFGAGAADAEDVGAAAVSFFQRGRIE